jgi:hypothetical protein
MHLKTQDKSNKQQNVYIHLQQKKGPQFPMEFYLALQDRWLRTQLKQTNPHATFPHSSSKFVFSPSTPWVDTHNDIQRIKMATIEELTPLRRSILIH